VNLQPTLRGTSIELHPLKLEDFDELLKAASDPLIWEQHPERDRYKPDVFQKYFDSGIESKGAFVVIDLQSDEIIGSSRYYKYNPDRREVAIGYTFLKRPFWGGATNREMKSLMLDHAFQFVDRVFFEVGENNLRSRKALEKIGARFFEKTPDYVVYVIERVN
jgi:RimJ/RimL family protein N-acetyltransferase